MCSCTVGSFTSCTLWTEQTDERCCTQSASLRCRRVWDGIDMQIESSWLTWALFLMFRRHIFTPFTYVGIFFFHSVYDEVFCYPQWTIKTRLLRSVYSLHVERWHKRNRLRPTFYFRSVLVLSRITRPVVHIYFNITDTKITRNINDLFRINLEMYLFLNICNF